MEDGDFRLFGTPFFLFRLLGYIDINHHSSTLLPLSWVGKNQLYVVDTADKYNMTIDY